MSDWADEEAVGITGPCTCDAAFTSRKRLDPRCKYHDDLGHSATGDIAAALRKAKAAGVRYGAEYFVVLDPDTFGPWAYNLRAQADKIERGEA
jgi:hypothetical protein